MSFFESLIETFIIYFKIIFLKRKIILGPYHGEFGFEVTMNTSIAFSLSRRFKNYLVVVSLEGHEQLYRYCDEFISFNYDLKKAGYAYGNSSDSKDLKLNFITFFPAFKNEIFIDLSRINIFLFKKLINFDFVDLSTTAICKSSIVAVHFRSILKEGVDSRSNFQNINSDLLVKKLFDNGYTVYVLGNPKYSYCPPNYCEDHRSNNIGFALNAISNSCVTIGQLSGPIHLAHMSNRPVITWADSEERFETIKIWNPHKQDCLVVSDSTFNPDVDLIINSLLRFAPPSQS